MSPEDKQKQLAKNLGTLYQGISGSGHKEMPKPLPETTPTKPKTESIMGQGRVFKNLLG